MAIMEVTVHDDTGVDWTIRHDSTTGRWNATSSFDGDPPERSFTRSTLQESIAYVEAQQAQPVVCDACGARAIVRAGTNCGRRLGDVFCVGTLLPEAPSSVMVLTGDPVGGFRLIGPAEPNSTDIEELTGRVLKHDYWWYLPFTSVHDALAGLYR